MSSQAAGPRPVGVTTAPSSADGTAVRLTRLRGRWERIAVRVDSRTAQALAHPLPAARLHTNICY